MYSVNVQFLKKDIVCPLFTASCKMIALEKFKKVKTKVAKETHIMSGVTVTDLAEVAVPFVTSSINRSIRRREQNEEDREAF